MHYIWLAVTTRWGLVHLSTQRRYQLVSAAESANIESKEVTRQSLPKLGDLSENKDPQQNNADADADASSEPIKVDDVDAVVDEQAEQEQDQEQEPEQEQETPVDNNVYVLIVCIQWICFFVFVCAVLCRFVVSPNADLLDM